MDLCTFKVGNLVIPFPIYLVVNMYNDLSGKPTNKAASNLVLVFEMWKIFYK